MKSRRRQPDATAWPGRWPITIAVGSLVVAATVWWRTARDPLPAARARVTPQPSIATQGGSPRAARVIPLPVPPVAPYSVHGTPGLSHEDPLTAYRKANVYPPTSRPLSNDQLDLLKPNQRHEAVRAADHGEGVTYLFTADRYFVIGNESLTATLDVRRNGKPIPVTIVQAYAAVLDPVTHNEYPIPLSFTPSGSILASTFVPAKLDLPRQAAIGMYVEFDHSAGKQRAHFDFQYTPVKGIPARFTGVFTDTLDAGSLVIHAGVEVMTPGHYVIDCNLFDASDQPVAWTRFKGELAAGIHDPGLLFFGKVIIDGNAHGPFRIGQLRGARYAPGLDPDLEQMPPYTGSYMTRPYPTDAFSDAEYDSPEKQRMIDMLGNQPTHRGGAGGGDSGGTDGPN